MSYAITEDSIPELIGRLKTVKLLTLDDLDIIVLKETVGTYIGA